MRETHARVHAARRVPGALHRVITVVVGQCLLASALAAEPADSTTTPQAAYAHYCLSCHGATLQGGEFGPALTGATFAQHWSSQPPAALEQYVSTKMPPSGPGSLSASVYAAILTHLRQVNGNALAAADPDAAQTKASVAETGAGAAAASREEAERNARLFSSSVKHDAIYDAVIADRVALLKRVSPVNEAQLQNPSPNDWLHWRRTYDALGYSPLARIDRSNVGTLHTAWSWTLPPSVNEITPLVHDGILFIASGASVEALNAATGDRLWQYLRVLPDEADGGRNARTKSLAVAGNLLFAPTADGHMVALEIQSGKLAWDRAVIAPEQNAHKSEADGSAFHIDGGPVVAKGKVMVGVSLGVTHGKGGAYIVALDANDGHEVWRFNTVARPGEPGGDSWNGHPLAERYGAGVWTPGSYDPALNLVYFGTGNTYTTATLLVPDTTERAGNRALYTDSTLALDPESGKLKWYYQHMSRDVWDLDWAFERSLLDVPVAGRARHLLLTGGKMALFDALDRSTGQYLFSRDLGLQNVVQRIDPKTGRKSINPAVQPQAGKTTIVCPYATSGRNWPATSINPQSLILYVPLAESCMSHTFTPGTPAETAAGGVDAKMEQHVPDETDGKFGRLAAIDLSTGKPVWTQRQRATPSSAMLATGGGLVFNGDHDRAFRAYDDRSGAILWQTRLNAPPASYPITYAVGGEQFIAVVAGAGNALEATRSALTPEIETAVGNPVLFVFKLPAQAQAAAQSP